MIRLAWLIAMLSHGLTVADRWEALRNVVALHPAECWHTGVPIMTIEDAP